MSTQMGDHSINIGKGNFRGAVLQVVQQSAPRSPQEQLSIERAVLLRRPITQRTLEAFAIVSGIASIGGLYFTLFSPFRNTVLSSWRTAAFFTFFVAFLSGLVAVTLKRQRFSCLGLLCLELGKKGGVYLTRLRATCPWCKSRMSLHSAKPKAGSPTDTFVCERNPSLHRVLLDPTILPDIDE